MGWNSDKQKVDIDMTAEGIATESTLADVKTAVQIIDNFVSNNRGLVTEDNSANIFKSLKGLIDVDTTYTYNADGTVATKTITDGTLTAVITYTWTDGNLTSKAITVS